MNCLICMCKSSKLATCTHKIVSPQNSKILGIHKHWPLKIRCTYLQYMYLIPNGFYHKLFFMQADLVNEFNRPLPGWPSKGVVEFKNYSTRYRSGLDLVLKDINFKVNVAEKVKHAFRDRFISYKIRCLLDIKEMVNMYGMACLISQKLFSDNSQIIDQVPYIQILPVVQYYTLF